MWGKMACLVGAHDWSEWEVRDPDRPSEQVRACARCGLMKTNAAPAPNAWRKHLLPNSTSKVQASAVSDSNQHRVGSLGARGNSFDDTGAEAKAAATVPQHADAGSVTLRAVPRSRCKLTVAGRSAAGESHAAFSSARSCPPCRNAVITGPTSCALSSRTRCPPPLTVCSRADGISLAIVR